MDDPLASLTGPHRTLRRFAVRELPRNGGRPLGAAQIAGALGWEVKRVERLLADLEKGLFFLVRNAQGAVSWAFPVTTARTPHRLRFSSGETIFGA